MAQHPNTYSFFSSSCSPVTNSNGVGAVIESYEFRRTQAGATAFWTPLRLPGQYHDDETDLVQNWNRFYSPSVGRFLGPDPYSATPSGLLASEPAGPINGPYLMAGNNYTAFSDPTGNDAAGLGFTFAVYTPWAEYSVELYGVVGHDDNMPMNEGWFSGGAVSTETITGVYDGANVEMGGTGFASPDANSCDELNGETLIVSATVSGAEASLEFNSDGSLASSNFDILVPIEDEEKVWSPSGVGVGTSNTQVFGCGPMQ
jgi:RHS repeat-associated protein